LYLDGTIKSLIRLLILTAVLIIYGSLYPWEFATKWNGDPLSTLIHTFRFPIFNRFVLRDVIVNVSMYVPIGATGYLAFQGRGKFFAYLVPAIVGMSLSLAVEIAQFYTPFRTPSMVDVLTNTVGAIAGIVLAATVRDLLPTVAHKPAKRRVTDPAAVALLCCGIAYLLFPFFPLLSQTRLAGKSAVFRAAPWFAVVPFVSATVAWFVGCRLALTVTAFPRIAIVLLAMIGISAQWFVLGRQPLPSMLLGALTGLAMFLIVTTPRWAIVAAGCVIVVLLARGLAPFHWQAAANPFTWTPFGGVLAADWQNGMLFLIEKTYFFGIALWTFRRAGARWPMAIFVIMAIAAVIEFAQIHVPGRTPEITDPLLVLLTGLILQTRTSNA
jgi:VanZ family protein